MLYFIYLELIKPTVHHYDTSGGIIKKKICELGLNGSLVKGRISEKRFVFSVIIINSKYITIRFLRIAKNI